MRGRSDEGKKGEEMVSAGRLRGEERRLQHG